ncbi:hypothetical protein GC088_09880 [Arthrobacter sp. JZ12]|uniref:hypothetical protein n=1 Tax=Arthrobacter sp. JZ12 TaxID=2654190 RepID=UPI002B47409E|nr:hypothetical protein [Arthrobacter sp. JZ12]WRH25339.1 hypothetical protein GC088_09880 [Arthrobacter sp. JZ12]
MIEQVHATEHGDWQIRTASGTIYRLQASAAGSFLTRYAQILAPTSDYQHVPVYDLRKDGTPIPVLAFSGVQLGEEVVFTLQIRNDGVETVRHTTPAVSIEVWKDEPIPEKLPHRATRLPWMPTEIRLEEL